MARALFLFVVAFLGNLVAPSPLPEEQADGITVRGHDAFASNIVNLDLIFPNENGQVLKAGKGRHGKDKKDKKERKKKKHSSSDSDDGKPKGHGERRSDRSVVAPEEPRFHQQEVAGNGRQSNRHVSREETTAVDEESITVRGPIRRKPLIYPNS